MEERGKQIRKVAILGILLNIFTASVKIIIGFISGSVAVSADAANNLTDVLSSAVTLIGYDFGKHRATHSHPMGFGRIEYISALFVSLIIILTGAAFFKSSVESVFKPRNIYSSFTVIVLLFISALAKIFLWKYNGKVGKRTDSEALIASGKDAFSDALSTFVTIVGIISSSFTSIPVDGLAGIAVSLFILRSGFVSVCRTVSTIVGERPDKKTVNEIRYIISKHPPLTGGYDIMIHSYGPERKIGVVNVDVPFDASAEEIFDAETDAREDILSQMNIYMTFGMAAVNSSNPKVVEMKEKVLLCLKNASDAVIDIHAFHIHFEDMRVHFDLVVDFSVEDFSLFRQRITNALTEEFPGYSFKFNIDPDFS